MCVINFVPEIPRKTGIGLIKVIDNKLLWGDHITLYDERRKKTS